MKHSKVALTAFGVLIAMLAFGIVSAADTGTDHTITASGTGSVIGTPDRAQISLAVETENFDVRVAQVENAARMTQVMDALKAAGIPEDALKTTGYNIYPVYEESKGILNPKVKTYQVTNTLTVTLHDVSRTGEVIDIAVANGINQADSIRFMLSEQQQQVLRTAALKEAVDRARADADTVAGAMGTAITGVQSADISGGYYPVLFQNYQYAGAAEMRSASSTPVQPGDITVSATVTIAYIIR